MRTRLNILKFLLPERTRCWLRDRYRRAERGWIAFDRVTDWRVLRRLHPYRSEFGRRRGQCIDRYYIEEFLGSHKRWIRGVVGEFESDDYTRQFGGDQVERAEILDRNERNTRRTIALDLALPASVPDAMFDCIICTQTLFLISDYHAALQSLLKMLKPGGVLLATFPGICPVVRGELIAGAGEDCWRFTRRSAELAFGQIFGSKNISVQTYGNVLTTTAFLHGLVREELTSEELAFHDADFELVIGVKAVKVSASQ